MEHVLYEMQFLATCHKPKPSEKLTVRDMNEHKI